MCKLFVAGRPGRFETPPYLLAPPPLTPHTLTLDDLAYREVIPCRYGHVLRIGLPTERWKNGVRMYFQSIQPGSSVLGGQYYVHAGPWKVGDTFLFSCSTLARPSETTCMSVPGMAWILETRMLF